MQTPSFKINILYKQNFIYLDKIYFSAQINFKEIKDFKPKTQPRNTPLHKSKSATLLKKPEFIYKRSKSLKNKNLMDSLEESYIKLNNLLFSEKILDKNLNISLSHIESIKISEDNLKKIETFNQKPLIPESLIKPKLKSSFFK